MTLFIKLDEGLPVGHPVTEQSFRQLFPNTSFPRYYTAAAVEPLGYGIYDFSNPPEVGRHQKAVEISPVRSEAGIWRQSWQVAEMNDAEKADADIQQAAKVRSQRNLKLSSTDWWALSDVTMTEAQAAYRQALRDITDHANWPYLEEADWPVKPE
jgi:hypothetical protein